ncbi:MAG: hypothetical protein EBR82_10070 [Caulobacteraceae bacterium]|nr:hypothetical protein [Caulobacteraceae bacterium]
MTSGVPYERTEEHLKLVESHSAMGTRYEDIAILLGISSDTLTKYYKVELEEGRIKANAVIANSLYNKAKLGDTTAQIFWLKTRAGFSEKQKIEHSGFINGGQFDLSKLTNEELKTFQALMVKASVAPDVANP